MVEMIQTVVLIKVLMWKYVVIHNVLQKRVIDNVNVGYIFIAKIIIKLRALEVHYSTSEVNCL